MFLSNCDKEFGPNPLRDGEGTPREVGVNLKQGYNGDLTSKQAGSVGGQMVNIMTPVRTATYQRASRTSMGHCQAITYAATITA